MPFIELYLIWIIRASRLYHEFADREDRLIGERISVVENVELQHKFMLHWNELRMAIAAIPMPEKLDEMLTLSGAAPDQLPITTEAVERGLQHAHIVRDRYTLLRFINEEVKA